MHKQKKPYLRQKSPSKILAIFNTQNRDFAGIMIDHCHKNGIACFLEKTTPSGHKRYVVHCSPSQILELKNFINRAYSEFCHYNKQLRSYTKSDINELEI